VRRDLLGQLNAARAEKRRVCLVRLLDRGGTAALVVEGRQVAGDPLSPELLAAVESAHHRDKSEAVDSPTAGRAFLQVFNPPLRMIVVGAVHIAQALVPMASLAGYAVTVVDPRRAFATDERFPAVAVSTDWPDEALESLAPDRRTAVITLTHDPKLDDPALLVALRSEAFYVGALGSRRTHAKRLERLRGEGADEAGLSRVRGPAGLDIGAVSPAEIAVSVLAQMTHALRRAGAAA
jgi:xanthine dehydrogenase accessory factor